MRGCAHNLMTCAALLSGLAATAATARAARPAPVAPEPPRVAQFGEGWAAGETLTDPPAPEDDWLLTERVEEQVEESSEDDVTCWHPLQADSHGLSVRTRGSPGADTCRPAPAVGILHSIVLII